MNAVDAWGSTAVHYAATQNDHGSTLIGETLTETRRFILRLVGDTVTPVASLSIKDAQSTYGTGRLSHHSGWRADDSQYFFYGYVPDSVVAVAYSHEHAREKETIEAMWI